MKVGDIFTQDTYENRWGQKRLSGPGPWNNEFRIEKGSVLCQESIAHQQEWVVVRVVEKNERKIHFCYSPGCEYCRLMKKRVARLEKHIKTGDWKNKNDACSDIIRELLGKVPLEKIVDEIICSVPFAHTISRRFPWDREAAREWLDGERDAPPKYNIDILLEKEKNNAGPEAAKKAMLAFAAIDARRFS